MSYQQHKGLDKELLLGIHFNDEQSIRRLSGTPSGTYSFSQGEVTFTTDAKIAFSNPVYGIKSIRLIVDLDSTTEDILNLSASHSIEAGAGTVTATGVSSPTIYVDGSAASTITTNKAEIVITTTTAFDADDIVAGYVSAYLEGKISLIEFYNVTLSTESISNLYNDARYVVPNLNSNGRQVILDVNAFSGVALEISEQNTITQANVANFKDGNTRVAQFNGTSSLIESTLADDVNTISFWCKPKTDTVSIIDLGGGNTITIASGVLTAAWADDLYVNGEAGTAIATNEWNHVVCRVDTALALTAIDIGKVSTAFYGGLLSDIKFVDGIVSDAEISQMWSSNKMKYSQ